MARCLPIAVGAKYGNWEVLGRASSPGVSRSAHYSCRCKCGQVRILRSQDLVHGIRKACGCMGHGNRLRPYESLYNTFRKYASYREVAVFITYEQFLTLVAIKECHYCGADIYWRIYDDQPRLGKPRTHGYNLDRKDPKLYYVMSNVVVCCKRCNMAKSNYFSYEEWVEVGKLLRSFRERREHA
jgi:hypothetical protein